MVEFSNSLLPVIQIFVFTDHNFHFQNSLNVLGQIWSFYKFQKIITESEKSSKQDKTMPTLHYSTPAEESHHAFYRRRRLQVRNKLSREDQQ